MASILFGIIGEDSRHDYFNFNPRERRSADSVAAIIDVDFINFNGRLITKPLGKRFEEAGKTLCPGERFSEQPTANGLRGTGFLVAPNIIATSSHFDSGTTVRELAFVFGFRKNDEATTVTTFQAGDIYRGIGVRRGQGWALVRLDRPVVGHSVAELRRDGAINGGQGLYVIGHPLGLPMKRAEGKIISNDPGPFFETDLDAYEGNSGSPVFRSGTDQDGGTDLVEGILINGLGDFVQDGNCFKSKRILAAAPGQAETCVRVTEFAHLI